MYSERVSDGVTIEVTIESLQLGGGVTNTESLLPGGVVAFLLPHTHIYFNSLCDDAACG